MSRFFKALLVTAILVFCSTQLKAQVITAAIHGSVTDSSGAVIQNAQVTVMDTATGIVTRTSTNHRGYYLLPALQIGGPYTVEISAAGFKKFAARGLLLTVNANRDVDASLVVGAATQVIAVQSAEVQVETSNTQLEQVVTQQQIDDLPLLGRDAAGLQKLTPGTVESSDAFGSFATNGSQTQSDSFLLNGADNNDDPLQDEGLIVNPDAIQEENIVTSTINPEFARNSGAIVNQVIKSGSNAIHGSAFEYYRDTFLNNGNYFTLPNSAKPPSHKNLYGMTLGGPVIKNRLFLFLAYQGSRQRTGGTTQTPVFTSATAGGNFSNDTNIANSTGSPGTTTNAEVGLTTNSIPFNFQSSTGYCGPSYPAAATWASCFPTGNVVIPKSSFNSLAEMLASQYVPGANAGTATAPLYNFIAADTFASDQGVVRTDYHIGDSDSVYGLVLFQSSPSTDTLPYGGATVPGFAQYNAQHYKVWSAAWTHTFNANTVNELRAGYYRLNFGALQPQKVVKPSSVGFNINPQFSESGLPTMSLGGLFTLGFSPAGPQPRRDTNITGADVLSKTVGNHALKFGATFEQFRVSNPYYAYNNGYYAFDGGGTYSSGDPAIDYLMGIPDNYEQQSGGVIDARSWELYGFAQDSWKMSSDVTVNYGLGWDVEAPNSDSQFGGEGTVCFSVSTATSKIYPGGPPGLLYPGDTGCNRQGGATTKFDHFGPRVGFAWSPHSGPSKLIGSGAHELSVRGGFGLYYNRDPEEGQLQALGDPPFTYTSYGAADFLGSPAFANPFTDVAGNGSEANPYPFATPKSGSAINWANFTELDLSTIDAKYDVPYVYNFNLNIQRELPAKMLLQIGYVGSQGRHLETTYDGDPITPAGHAACLANAACYGTSRGVNAQHLFFPQNAAQPATTGGIPDFVDIGTIATRGSSNYNSLQVSLTKGMTHGLTFTTAYTYSHGLDTASGLESSGFRERGMNNIPGFQHLNYGDSDYDARQRFVVSYIYEVPLMAALKRSLIARETLGGWHVAGVTTLQTGFPVLISDYGIHNSLWSDAFTYYNSPDNPNTTAFKVKSLNPRAAGSAWFNTSVFTQEAVGTFGNTKRNYFHGPGFNYTNLNIFKEFSLGGARSLTIALQSANVFNHANFAAPDGNFSDGPNYFGKITAVNHSADYNSDPSPGRSSQLVAKFHF